MNIYETIAEIHNTHRQYYSELNAHIRFDQPTYTITPCSNRFAGRYFHKLHVCQYSLPYALVEGDRYRAIVAHEMAHAWVSSINRNAASHGEMWKWALRDVLGFTFATVRHSIPVPTKLGELLLLQYKLGELPGIITPEPPTKENKNVA
jgi:predicted SprT family Zn-dependent metalloprotease